ncbi:MAG: helix-turn-helix domain-containing protein, partial [Gemmatimonadaceae bacterium]
VLAIRQSYGAISLDGLTSELRTTPRTLQRQFLKRVGIAPKLFARVTRFQRVFYSWKEDPQSLSRVAAECGYFDQSHLIRDFRDFAGTAPAAMLEKQPEFTSFFLPR